MSTPRLLDATQHFVTARHFEMIGEYRKADAEYRKSDKIMAQIFDDIRAAMMQKAAKTS